VVCKLNRKAAAWWNQLQFPQRRQGKQPVITWRRMKQLLNGRFLSPDYKQILNNQFEQYKQGTRTVIAYMEEFYHLALQCDLSLTEEQQTIKYIHGLKYPIQERVALQDLYPIDEAQNKAMRMRGYRTRPTLQARSRKDIR